MTTRKVSEAAATMGRIGGSVSSPEKTRAVRLNGRKGGRPRKPKPKVKAA